MPPEAQPASGWLHVLTPLCLELAALRSGFDFVALFSGALSLQMQKQSSCIFIFSSPPSQLLCLHGCLWQFSTVHTASSCSLKIFFSSIKLASLTDSFPALQEQSKMRNVTKNLGNYSPPLWIFPRVLCWPGKIWGEGKLGVPSRWGVQHSLALNPCPCPV